MLKKNHDRDILAISPTPNSHFIFSSFVFCSTDLSVCAVNFWVSEICTAQDENIIILALTLLHLFWCYKQND